MEKKKTPVSTVVFYIIGIILLIVSLFMLWTAVNYTKTYLATYDASFKDMWTNSVQYIITQFLPYCGMGVICLGLGRAIYGTANAKASQPAENAAAEAAEAADAAKAEDAAGAAADVAEAEEADAAADAATAEAAEASDAVKAEEAAAPAASGAAGAAAGTVSADQMAELIRRIDTNREVLSIKIEEKEKRDSFRIKELEKKVEDFLSDVKYINEPLEELVYKQAAGIDDEEIPTAEAAAAGPAAETEVADAAAEGEEAAADVAGTGALQKAAGLIPQIFRMARSMTMPSVPKAVAEAPAEPAEEPAVAEAPIEAPEAAEEAAVQTVAEAPAEPEAEVPAEAGPTPQIFRVARSMTMPACPAAAADAAGDEMPLHEAGAVPQIFTVARRMTMPKC